MKTTVFPYQGTVAPPLVPGSMPNEPSPWTDLPLTDQPHLPRPVRGLRFPAQPCEIAPDWLWGNQSDDPGFFRWVGANRSDPKPRRQRSDFVDAVQWPVHFSTLTADIILFPTWAQAPRSAPPRVEPRTEIVLTDFPSFAETEPLSWQGQSQLPRPRRALITGRTPQSWIVMAWQAGSQIPAPTLNTATLAAGGTLTVAQPYFYVVTATTEAGETTASNELSATPTLGNQTVNLAWGQVTSATGYKVYRGTSSGANNTLIAVITSGATVTYSDTGTSLGSFSPPTNNTARLNTNWEDSSCAYQVLPQVPRRHQDRAAYQQAYIDSLGSTRTLEPAEMLSWAIPMQRPAPRPFRPEGLPHESEMSHEWTLQVDNLLAWQQPLSQIPRRRIEPPYAGPSTVGDYLPLPEIFIAGWMAQQPQVPQRRKTQAAHANPEPTFPYYAVVTITVAGPYWAEAGQWYVAGAEQGEIRPLGG